MLQELNACHTQWQNIKEKLLILKDIKDTDSMETDQEGNTPAPQSSMKKTIPLRIIENVILPHNRRGVVV